VNSSAAAESLLVMMHCLNAVDMKMQLLVCGVQRNVFVSYVIFKLERSANLCCTSSNTVVDGRYASVAQN
jgi:hypothetical protein